MSTSFESNKRGKVTVSYQTCYKKRTNKVDICSLQFSLLTRLITDFDCTHSGLNKI